MIHPTAPLKEYYDTRAPEYDDWYLGRGRFANQHRPEWEEDLRALVALLACLPPARMLAIAGERLPGATLVGADALSLPFEQDSFERVFTAHFYGHLQEPERRRFLDEARRVAPELIVVDSALAGARAQGRKSEEWQERVLNDGSRFTVYKRYFDGEQLAAELGGGSVLLESRWFVAVLSPRP